ncbi:MAG: pilus assembly protein PilM [Candidatus Taylorbacteria bacterium]|nr:pilus assembly protein PilM [Candidatus Taylorbacteria bacterium]
MRHLSSFFKFFPPPKLLTMSHAGLEISDDAIRCIVYKITSKGYVVSRYAKTDLPVGLIENGEVKDEEKYREILSSFTAANRLDYVKVSLPEEKVYLFQTEILSADIRAIEQNVEFKLEENVPLASSEAVFYFDILPTSVTGGTLRASVSVVSKSYVERYIALLKSMSITPVAFEVVPKSIAKAIVSEGSDETDMIIHAMDRKTGIYIVSGGVVCFSSTVAWCNPSRDHLSAPAAIGVDSLIKEIDRVCSYWATRPDTHSAISKILIVGRDAVSVQNALLSHADAEREILTAGIADIWHNVFDIDSYIPPISHDESLEYAVVSGLAMPL